ncbi:hypothetical protein [Streptomyces poonensis]|uniref:Uncharacterized protein n=1 Tax=Streptomyces poonensis TaxID=68255 RepID=A0A918Q121_9ACTN|nr:hypothetical protein [Streptomyces poonensis]GGZ30321.1 hypothetical protein GCM10010365_58550 [Streptomyces poonensis]
MRPSNQARANEARRRQAETGESYASALAAVRRDRLRAADSLTAASGKPGDPPDFHDVPVPQELPELVRYHAHRIVRYLAQAVDEGRWADGDFAEWQRMTLYKLTDGLEHLHLLIGTISAYLRDADVPPSHLRRYLQVGEDRHVQAFLTPRVEEHLAGLTQRPKPENSIVWHSVGADIAAREGWCDPDRHDTLEVWLNALCSSYPDDPQALDHLPPRLRERVLALVPHLRITGPAEQGT